MAVEVGFREFGRRLVDQTGRNTSKLIQSEEKIE